MFERGIYCLSPSGASVGLGQGPAKTTRDQSTQKMEKNEDKAASTKRSAFHGKRRNTTVQLSGKESCSLQESGWDLASFANDKMWICQTSKIRDNNQRGIGSVLEEPTLGKKNQHPNAAYKDKKHIIQITDEPLLIAPTPQLTPMHHAGKTPESIKGFQGYFEQDEMRTVNKNTLGQMSPAL